MNVYTFRDKWTKRFKNLSFSRNPPYILLRTCTGKLALILLGFVFGTGNFGLLSSEL